MTPAAPARPVVTRRWRRLDPLDLPDRRACQHATDSRVCCALAAWCAEDSFREGNAPSYLFRYYCDAHAAAQGRTA